MSQQEQRGPKLILLPVPSDTPAAQPCAGCCRMAWRSLRWSARRAPQARRLSPRVTLRGADDENISALRNALAGADQMILISSDSEARARHVAPCKHHVGGYSRQPPTHQLHEHR